MKLEKILHEMVHSPQKLWETIDPGVVGIGFIYSYKYISPVTILTLYVNDLLIVGGKFAVLEDVRRS